MKVRILYFHSKKKEERKPSIRLYYDIDIKKAIFKDMLKIYIIEIINQ